jgi:hypothetical protein
VRASRALGFAGIAAAERWWLSVEAGGAGLPSLWAGTPDPSWNLTPDDTPASVVAAYRAEWAAHVVQETARHVGHLDVLRGRASRDYRGIT